jgi:hypothetical protein
MSSDDPSLQPLIVLRVVIRSPDLPTFVSKYSRFIKDDRIFIFTKSSQPPGTRVRFTLELSDGQPLITGEGTVTRIRPDSGDVTKPPGMELKFVPLDEASRELVGRMLQAREGTGQFAAVQTPPPPPPAPHGQFREETTDAQTNIRDGSTSSSMPREFDESVPTLQPLEKTGAQAIIVGPPQTRQDESGAVTIAQAPPRDRTSPDEAKHEDTPPPSLPLPSVRVSSLPLDTAADRQSGGFSTPTPLPAPIPAASDEFGASPPPTKLARPSQSDAVTTGTPALYDSGEVAFAAAGPAPAFAEAFRAPMPGLQPPAGVPPTGTVPANPFSEVSDGAIEYFVEWSLEQSTAPRPKVAQAHFANIAMATPKAERRRSMRGPLLSGMAIGIFLGLPLGGAIVWFGRPLPPPVIVEKMPEGPTPARHTVEAADLALARHEPAADLAVAVAVAVKPTGAPVKPPKPTVTAVKPTGAPDKPVVAVVKPSGEPDKPETPDETSKSDQPEKPAKPPKVDKAELSVVTHPAGAAVAVDGEPRGKSPLTLSLPAGTHELVVTRDRYSTVTQSVELPAKVDLILKRPTATLHIDSEPAGGEVIVEGKPRGKTPVDVTLEAFHHYDVQVMLLGTKPWHKRVNLKPPQVNVTATLSVTHAP